MYQNVTFFNHLGQIVTKKSNIINFLEKINLFERIYVLDFIHLNQYKVYPRNRLSTVPMPPNSE